MDIEDALRRRYWVRQNFEWLMGEVSFHREMKQYFKNQKIRLWVMDTEEGRANPYEAPE